MKRILEAEIPDASVRVPLPHLPRVLSVDNDGVETLAAAPTPADVQNAANKRAYRAHEWGKNLNVTATVPETPFERLPEDEKRLVLNLGFAKAEMAALGQFCHAVAEGQRMQVDYVPVLLPSEAEERQLRANRLERRRHALRTAAATFGRAAQRMEAAVPSDRAYLAELRALRRAWTLELVGGAKFLPVLSVVCAANYALPGGDSHVTLLRSAGSGSVEVRVPALLRPRLCVNGACHWPSVPAAGVATGVPAVHAMLLELHRSAKARVLYRLLAAGAPAAGTGLAFAAVRDEGSALVAELLIGALATETVTVALGQPDEPVAAARGPLAVEAYATHLLLRALRLVRRPTVTTFGERSELAQRLLDSGLSWSLAFHFHERSRRDATLELLSLARQRCGRLGIVWTGTECRGDGGAVSSAVCLARTGRVAASLLNASEFCVDGDLRSQQWGIEEVKKAVLAALAL